VRRGSLQLARKRHRQQNVQNGVGQEGAERGERTRQDVLDSTKTASHDRNEWVRKLMTVLEGADSPPEFETIGPRNRFKPTFQKKDAICPRATDLPLLRPDRSRIHHLTSRPHEALDDEAPASRWAPSPRRYPARIKPPEYPGHFEVRRVSNAGEFKIGAQHRFLIQALKGDYIGLEPPVARVLCRSNEGSCGATNLVHDSSKTAPESVTTVTEKVIRRPLLRDSPANRSTMFVELEIVR